MRTRRSLSALFSALLIAGLGLGGCDLLEEGIDIPITFTQSFDVPVDLGQATGAAAGQQAPQDATYPLGLGAVPIDLVSSNAQIAANRSKIQAIEFTSVSVTPKNNTLTGPTPVIDLYVGPAGATQPSQGIKIATLPSVAAGSTATTQAVIDTQAQALAQNYLTSLDFTLLPVATLSVTKGQTVPGGAATLTIQLGVKATLNPVK